MAHYLVPFRLRWWLSAWSCDIMRVFVCVCMKNNDNNWPWRWENKLRRHNDWKFFLFLFRLYKKSDTPFKIVGSLLVPILLQNHFIVRHLCLKLLKKLPRPFLTSRCIHLHDQLLPGCLERFNLFSLGLWNVRQYITQCIQKKIIA